MSADTLRIDRWLYFCRFFKTRSLASKAVGGGHVKLNGERASPGAKVRPGDRLAVTKNQATCLVTVNGIPARRGPAREAATCYVEDPESIAARERKSAAIKRDRLAMPSTKGRPDKHTRRKLISRKEGGG